MAEPPVVNASPLIFLASANLLELLLLAGDKVVVPEKVASEIWRRSEEDRTVAALARTPWLEVVQTPFVPPIIEEWDLGPGESSVLAWAFAHPGVETIIDDLRARRCATALGIPVRGTVGLVLTAKSRGTVPLAGPILLRLRDKGMYLSDEVLDRALALVGE